MQHLHIIPHTHWNREWYPTFQQCRLKLVHLVNNLLAILDADLAYRHFMLDGQTIVLEDYLQMRMVNFDESIFKKTSLHSENSLRLEVPSRRIISLLFRIPD
ncbi:MAG: hypothetical protein WA110_00125 [Anaerolineaceae bacterium]